jgi:hypothetical protein
MFMMRIILPVLILCGLLWILPAQDAWAGQSSIPAAFADIGLDARIMGMGGAATAGTHRAADSFWNPAGLASLYRSEVTAMQTEQFGLVPAYLLAVGQRRNESLGLGAALLSSGDTLLRENTLILAMGRRLFGESGTALGIAVKLRHASFGPEGDSTGIDGSARGAALDLGLLRESGAFSYGLVVEELFGDLKWSSSGLGDYHEGVPPTCTAGLRFNGGLLEVVGDIELALNAERRHKAALGVEWRPFSLLQIRGGMKQRLDAEALRFLTLGAGIGHDLAGGGRLQVDTAYLFHELGGSLRISASYGF